MNYPRNIAGLLLPIMVTLAGIEVSTALLTGCAFKQSKDSSAQQSGGTTNSTEAVKASDGTIEAGEVHVSFLREASTEVRHRKVQQSGRNITVATPITLPAEVPDTIRVKFDLASVIESASDLEAEVYVKPAGSTAQATKLPVRSVTFDGQNSKGSMTVEIPGMKALFPDGQDVVNYLTIEVLSRGRADKVTIANIALTTPPSFASIQSTQMTLDDFDRGERSELTDVVRAILTEGLKNDKVRLDLVSIVRLKNKSKGPIETAIPVKPHGRVWVQIDSYHPRIDGCSFDPGETHTADTLSDDLYALPITADLEQTFYPTLRAARKGSSIMITLDPTQEVVVGIFGQGPRIVSRPKSRANPIPATLCAPKCEEWAYVAPYADACVRCAQGLWGPCQECKNDNRFVGMCKRWGMQTHPASVMSGIQTTASVDIDPLDMWGTARFTYLPATDDPEVRRIKVFEAHARIE